MGREGRSGRTKEVSKRVPVTIDGIEAVAYVAYRLNEVIAIYPITPASGMGEWADEWEAQGIQNIWGTVPNVVEMQSEGGAAGAVHGSLQSGSLTTTFTASQGLLLKIPNMYKIAGELTPTVFNVSARSLACQALSIFGDHSDVMAARGTGFAMLASGSVQEAMDLTLISHAATYPSRIPFLHFFDGFRTSHEVSKIELLTEDDMRAIVDEKTIAEHRARRLNPDRPVLRGTAQNPDVFFQARESVNPYYLACPDITQRMMDKFAGIVGRSYRLFDYFGHPEADRVVVIMGSGAEVAHETIDYMNRNGDKTGLIKVRLYRPFDCKRFVEALPSSVKTIGVLDRTKEPGSAEPLYLDCVNAVNEGLENGWGSLAERPALVGGRYGLSSKEFTPAMVKALFDEMKKKKPKNHFTLGIIDDVTNTSIPWDPEYSTEPDNVVRALFYGLGSDGTVGANKNSIKIIGEGTDFFAQGYFVYDSKKAGAVTVSHLRFGPDQIRSSYLVSKASFIGCHQAGFIEKYDMLKNLIPGGTFLINCQWGADEVWDHLPRKVQEDIITKNANFYVIDAYKVAKESGMGGRINTIMQVCFFAISNVLPRDEAIQAIKNAIQKTYGGKGEDVVRQNFKAVDNSLDNLHQVDYPKEATSTIEMPPTVAKEAPAFVQEVTAEIMAGRGDGLPVSLLPADGTYPTGTTMWEKRNIALEIPVWDHEVCIQCGKCSMVCPHAAIRQKAYDPAILEKAPATFASTECKNKTWKAKGYKFTVQVAPEDCTGCGLCVDICPAKNKSEPELRAINMKSQAPLRESERENWEFFLPIPDMDRRELKLSTIREQQQQAPLFEFSGACGGCGETPYLKLLSQLYGDRAVIANATGCSSIYGGNLPTTPWTRNLDGKGPAWSNSLFEDNGEFGFGFRLAIDKQMQYATELLRKLGGEVGDNLVKEIVSASQTNEAEIFEQRERIKTLTEKLEKSNSDDARRLLEIADMLVKKSVWIVGGDGWAYDIGFGGLDHIFSMDRDVNILVLDTEVYSNTGGQASKATPRGAVAKYAAAGKPGPKKDLGLIAMTYNSVYVARCAMGASDAQTLKVFLEAESYPGPSLIIAYSHCIAHGIDMATGMQNQKMLVDSGQNPLFRFDPRLADEGKNPFQLDSKPPKVGVDQFMNMENRFRMVQKSNPDAAKQFLKDAQVDVDKRWAYYEYLANRKMD